MWSGGERVLLNYLSGGVTFGLLLASLFFLRFWKRTGDPLFLAFAQAFGLLGLAQIFISLTNIYMEQQSVFAYLVRLAAFAIIIAAIARKNRSG